MPISSLELGFESVFHECFESLETGRMLCSLIQWGLRSLEGVFPKSLHTIFLYIWRDCTIPSGSAKGLNKQIYIFIFAVEMNNNNFGKVKITF